MKKSTDTGLRALILFVFVFATGSFIAVQVLREDSPNDTPSEIIAYPELSETPAENLAQSSAPQIEIEQPVSYYSLLLSGTTTSPLEQLEEAVGAGNVDTVLKLNRIDSKFLKRGQTLTVPQDVVDFFDLSPFPQELSLAESIPKLLFISKRVQAFGVYESGELVRWGPVSTGTESSPTPSKLYSANWRAEEARSSFNYNWVMPWALNIDNRIGINIHQFDMPGYPASHSCVRTNIDDAKWLYSWVDLWVTSGDGTFRAHGGPVIIFGSYAYDEIAPWKNLPDDQTATTLSVEELETTLSEYSETIQNRQDGRDKMSSR